MIVKLWLAALLINQSVMHFAVKTVFKASHSLGIAGLADTGRVSEWLAASLEMKCPVRGCGFESRALRSCTKLHLSARTRFFHRIRRVFCFIRIPIKLPNLRGAQDLNKLNARDDIYAETKAILKAVFTISYGCRSSSVPYCDEIILAEKHW